MKPLERPALLLFALFSGSLLPAQQPPSQPAAEPHQQTYAELPKTADIISNVRAVLLDVVVTDSKGQPVKGLKKSDFVLKEDGVTQNIDSLHEHTYSTANAPQLPKAPPNYFTNIVPIGNSDSYTVILIDAANNTPSVQAYVRSQLISFMKTVQPGHPIAIFQLDTSIHLIQGFSADPAVLLKAVESKREEIAIPLVGIRERGYAPQEFRQDNLGDGLKAMGRYLAGFPGRKNLIWFSGSIPRAFWGGGLGSPFPDVEDVTAELSDATDALALNRVAVYPIDARGLETDPTYSAARSGIPRPNSTNSFETRRIFDHSDIEDVAQRTGGKAFYNTNGLKEAMAEVIDSGSNYYTLAYTPTNKNWDGKHREIKVEMDQSGLQLEYRHGYFARRETAQQSRRVAAAVQKAAQARGSSTQTESSYQPVKITAGPRGSFEKSMVLGAVPPTEILFATSIAPGTGTQKLEKDAPLPQGNYLREDLRKKPFRNYSILYAVDGSSLRFTTTPEGLHHGELVFTALVYDNSGEIVNSGVITRTFNLTDAEMNRATQGSIGIKQLISVPAKGNYFFRFGVHDTVADHIGAMEIPVDNVALGVLGPSQTPLP